jgi:hypothetical protein
MSKDINKKEVKRNREYVCRHMKFTDLVICSINFSTDTQSILFSAFQVTTVT